MRVDERHDALAGVAAQERDLVGEPPAAVRQGPSEAEDLDRVPTVVTVAALFPDLAVAALAEVAAADRGQSPSLAPSCGFQFLPSTFPTVPSVLAPSSYRCIVPRLRE
ncbi:hypothetical protein [Streptomyces sp. NPDC094468]|uniref:hypothetical protein n=1 Tax=Streptomyces sp. NPDC094468 TaxID=3366066 RepID=UPI003809FC87